MMLYKEYLQSIETLPLELKEKLKSVPNYIKEQAVEIRLRTGRNIIINIKNQNYILDIKLDNNEINEVYKSICNYSIHSKIEQIKRGYVTVKGGHRVGISGTAVYEKNEIVNIKNISSINIRIARQIKDSAKELLLKLNNNPGKTLIAGPPGSGKTTILRDIVRRLNDKNVSVIDTRGEIAAIYEGVLQNDVGNADVFDGYKRYEGIQIALRTMSPQIIVCDELGDDEDIRAIKDCVGAGVEIIATIHCYNKEDLKNRRIIREILKTQAFDRVVILKGRTNPSYIEAIEEVKRNDEINRGYPNKCMSANTCDFLFTKANNS